MSDHVPGPNPLETTDDRREAAAPNGLVPGRLDLNHSVAPPAGPDPGPVVFAELLATPKREMGAVIRPFQAGIVSLERRSPCTLVTIDP
jgi:hypothetical protein